MLKEGDVIELKKGMKIYAEVPETMVYSNRKGSMKLTEHDVTIGEKFDWFEGKYVVIKTTMDGGRTGYEPHDIYPDGHHVFCVSVENKELKVDFYQSGSFTAMIEDIEPIGKAELQWVIN